MHWIKPRKQKWLKWSVHGAKQTQLKEDRLWNRRNNARFVCVCFVFIFMDKQFLIFNYVVADGDDCIEQQTKDNQGTAVRVALVKMIQICLGNDFLCVFLFLQKPYIHLHTLIKIHHFETKIAHRKFKQKLLKSFHNWSSFYGATSKKNLLRIIKMVSFRWYWIS